MIPDPVRLESADELAVKLQPVNIEAANPSGGLTERVNDFDTPGLVI